MIFSDNQFTKSDIRDLLLIEARAAKTYWTLFRKLLPNYPEFKSRNRKGTDQVNILLNIGYHHLVAETRKIFGKHNIPTDVGLVHIAHTNKAEPLIYDLIELFRADVVDSEVLRFLRLKKNKLHSIKEREIAHFVHRISKRLNRRYFLKDFDSCQTYRYYMELQLLKFAKAINHQEIFKPLSLPSRHENRCTKCKASAI